MELLMEAIMDKIENEMDRLYWNKYQKDMESPFQNTGAEYSNETFTVRAYNWNGNDLPNFEYKDLKIWWYKHSHRGLCWEYNYGKNVLPQAIYLADMLDDCIESFRKECEKHEDAI